MADISLTPPFVDVPQGGAAEVAIVAIFSSRQALDRPIPAYDAQGPLELRLKLHKTHSAREAPQHLVTLNVTAELRQPDGALALSAEVHLEALAVCVGLSVDEELFHLERAIPGRLYAHARVIVEALTRDSGYLPLTLPPAPRGALEHDSDSP